MEVDGSDFPHAVFDHLGSEEVLFPLSLHRYLTVVLLEEVWSENQISQGGSCLQPHSNISLV